MTALAPSNRAGKQGRFGPYQTFSAPRSLFRPFRDTKTQAQCLSVPKSEHKVNTPLSAWSVHRHWRKEACLAWSGRRLGARLGILCRNLEGFANCVTFWNFFSSTRNLAPHSSSTSTSTRSIDTSRDSHDLGLTFLASLFVSITHATPPQQRGPGPRPRRLRRAQPLRNTSRRC